MDAAALPYRVERRPVGGHRGDVVHAAIDRAEQLVDRLELRLAALVEAAHQVAVHLDGLADIDEGARSAREEAMRDSLAEGVALEVVHSHGDEGEGGVGVVVEKAERHDADAGFEGEEVGLVVRSALWKDRYALVLRQSVPHGGEHLVIVDVGEELERERERCNSYQCSRAFRRRRRRRRRRDLGSSAGRRRLRFGEIQQSVGVAQHVLHHVGPALELDGALRRQLRCELRVCSLHVDRPSPEPTSK